MGERISAPSGHAKAQFGKRLPNPAENSAKGTENANDHEQQARVHPALPCYYVVVFQRRSLRASTSPLKLK
jgi:hypothetical protein